MKFSIILPSRLVPYTGCAQFLDQKLIRSIESVLSQSYKDFELIVVSDGCELTKTIVSTNFTDERLILTECVHKAIFDNLPRNTGIDNATGQYIIYIDADDYWGADHLKIIERNLKSYEWVWYNDIILQGDWIERACNVKTMGSCGTSNICYKRDLGLKWQKPGYSHDYYFIQQLLRFTNNVKIETPEYFVCHIPGQYDV